MPVDSRCKEALASKKSVKSGISPSLIPFSEGGGQKVLHFLSTISERTSNKVGVESHFFLVIRG